MQACLDCSWQTSPVHSASHLVSSHKECIWELHLEPHHIPSPQSLLRVQRCPSFSAPLDVRDDWARAIKQRNTRCLRDSDVDRIRMRLSVWTELHMEHKCETDGWHHTGPSMNHSCCARTLRLGNSCRTVARPHLPCLPGSVAGRNRRHSV